VEVVAVHAAHRHAHHLSDCCPEGQVDRGKFATSRGETIRPKNGTFRWRAVSTISFAHSHFQDRCLSLNTGTTRPSFWKTSITCLKNSYRGYFFCPKLVVRVVAVLADDQHGVDRELVGAVRSASAIVL